jgi:hypothetical protein
MDIGALARLVFVLIGLQAFFALVIVYAAVFYNGKLWLIKNELDRQRRRIGQVEDLQSRLITDVSEGGS